MVLSLQEANKKGSTTTTETTTQSTQRIRTVNACDEDSSSHASLCSILLGMQIRRRKRRRFIKTKTKKKALRVSFFSQTFPAEHAWVDTEQEQKMSDWNCLTDRRSDADITENYLEKTKLWSRQSDRQTGRDAQTSQNFGSRSRATEEERFTGKGNPVMKLAKLVLPFPKLGSCETTTPGREHEDGPRRQRRRRRRTGLVGVRASAGKSQKKTHPEKAKKKEKK